MIKICSWIILFNMLNKFVELIEISGEFKKIISALLEVTVGCTQNKNSPIFLAAILGFGGISVYFQVSENLNKAGVKAYEFFLIRFLNAGLSACVLSALLFFFPISVPTLARGMSFKISYQSLPFSALLIFTLAVFILDRNRFSSTAKK